MPINYPSPKSRKQGLESKEKGNYKARVEWFNVHGSGLKALYAAYDHNLAATASQAGFRV